MKSKTKRSAMWGKKFLAVSAFIIATLLPAQQWPRNVAPDLQNSKGPVNVIVTFKQPVNSAMHLLSV